jgi:hypothetical protein
MPNWTGNPILYGIFDGGFDAGEFFSILEYHATEMFPNILMSMPVWILFGIGIYRLFVKRRAFSWLFSLIGITFLYLFLELDAIGKVHDYYMFPFLPWLFILIGLGVDTLRQFSPKMIYLLSALCIWSAWFTPKETHSMWSLEKTYFNQDIFLHSEELKNAVPEDERCIILNDGSGYIFSYRVDKMGYIFKNDYLPVGWIDDMVRNDHVRYMYSDSEKINNQEEVQKYIDEVIMEKGSVKVMRLKIPEK